MRKQKNKKEIHYQQLQKISTTTKYDLSNTVLE